MNKEYSFLEIVAAVLFFVMFQPSFVWGINTFYLQYFLLFIMMIKTDWHAKGNIGLMLFFLIVLGIIPVTHGNNLFGFLAFLMFAFIPFAERQFSIRVFNLFKQILVTVTAFSIVIWIVVVLLHVNLPHTTIAPLNELKSHDYYSYLLLVVPAVPMDIMSISRFHCVFDEPGAIGTYCLILLYLDSFNFKKFANIVFLIAGLISFSLFFYVGLVIFLILRIFMIPSLRKFRFWAIVGLALFFLGTQKVPILNEMIGERLQYDKERNTFTGNNRTGGQLGEYIESIRGTSTYYWGDSRDVIEEFSGNASIYNAVLRYGAVFVILYFIFMFFYAKNSMRGNWSEILLFMLLVILTLYQRPGFVTPTYIFLFTCVVFIRGQAIEERKSLQIQLS